MLFISPGEYLRRLTQDSSQLDHMIQTAQKLLSTSFHNFSIIMSETLLWMLMSVVIFIMSRRHTSSRLKRVNLLTINHKAVNHNNIMEDRHVDASITTRDNKTNNETTLHTTNEK